MGKKKRKAKSPYTMMIEIMGIILIAYSFITIIFKDKTIEEKPQEEKIELVPYADYDFNKLSIFGNMSYEDDNYTSMFGIDVAAHQETIDWKKVKEAGVEFAYIRLGYRGATEGVLHTDLEFENNYKGAIENGIKVGIYWYSQPINEKEAYAEARYVINELNGRHIDLPIAYDFEETYFSDGTISRMHDMSKQDRTNMALTFCEELNRNGYDTIIYTNLDWIRNYYDMDKLKKYPIWLALYSNTPSNDYPFIMWQYTDTGTIDGIDHFVDLDIMFIRKNDQN